MGSEQEQIQLMQIWLMQIQLVQKIKIEVCYFSVSASTWAVTLP
jgi:hypothetical protein